MELKVLHVRTDTVDYRLVEIAGRMHYDDVPRFRQAVMPWVRGGHNTVIDCTDLVFICAAGTRIFFDAAEAAAKKPAAGCRAAGFQEHILADVPARHLHAVMDIRPTLGEALGDLGGLPPVDAARAAERAAEEARSASPTRWGCAVRDLMRESRTTQKELAAAAGVHENTIRGIVRHGKHTTTAVLERIAAALDVEVAELMMTPAQRGDWRERQQDELWLS